MIAVAPDLVQRFSLQYVGRFQNRAVRRIRVHLNSNPKVVILGDVVDFWNVSFCASFRILVTGP